MSDEDRGGTKSSEAVGSGDDVGTPRTFGKASDAAEYIAALATELSALAKRVHLDSVAQLLEMVSYESSEQARLLKAGRR